MVRLTADKGAQVAQVSKGGKRGFRAAPFAYWLRAQLLDN
jgi:hypothetical protein